jgi:outer membrane receptor protein involved in Fe transport
MTRKIAIKYWYWPILLLLLFCQFSCYTVHAQVTTATLSGTIVDQTGALVTNADLLLKNLSDGTERKTTSNTQGAYIFDFVPIGNYTLRVSRQGFQTKAMTGITLTAASVHRIDVTLSLASDIMEVHVNAEAENVALDTVTPQQSVSLSSQTLNQLPIAKSDWTTVLQLGAGVSTDNSSSTPAGTTLEINGLPPAGFNLTVDSTNATSDPEMAAFGFYQGPNIINTINNDAIAEVSIIKGIAPATIGGTMSGNVNLITRSGANQFHGTLEELNEVSAYDARNQFLTSKPRSTFNEYGGSIGGPILSNKLFFFGSYEGARVSSYSVVSGSVPTPYLKSIAPSVFDNILNQFPSVSQPSSDPTAIDATYYGSGALTQKDGNTVARLDYHPTENDLIYVRYIRGRPYKYAPNLVAINARATTGHTDSFNAAYTHSTSSFATLTRFGSNRIRMQRLDEGFSSDLEEISLGGFDSGGAEQFLKSGEFYTGEQQITKSIGKHSLIAGLIVQRQNAGRTDYNTATLGYSSLDEFLDNTPSKVVITFDLDPFSIHTYQLGGFLQDDWRITNNLTVNLGLRYDYYTVPKEDNNRLYNRGIDSSSPSLGGGYGSYRAADSLYNADFNNFQPRIGFSWSPDATKNTVIRGGAGIFVGPHPIYGGAIDEVQNSATEPFRVTLTGSQATNSGLSYPLPRSEYDTALEDLQDSGVISTEVVNTSISGNFPDPYSIQWMFGVERSLPASHRIEIDYVGNRGLKENMVLTKNLPNRTTGELPRSTWGQFRYYYAGDASNYHGLQVQLVNAPRHGLSYSASFAWSHALSFGDSNLLLEAVPQDADNIRADYGPTPYDLRTSFTGNLTWEIPAKEWLNMSKTPVKLLADGWQIAAVFKGHSGLPANITNGNSANSVDRPDAVAGVHRTLSGYRNVAGSHQYLNTAAFSSVELSTLSDMQIRGGTLGRYALNNPGSEVLDFSLGKTFKFGDKRSFALRADAFNALNHTNYSGLSTSIASSTFGQLTSATARTMQISGHFNF